MLAAETPALRASVRHRGLVSRDELFRLYRGATAFISLSTSEGFNLSAAEAATLGVALLLSDIPVHRELFAGYALFVGSEACDLGEIARYLATTSARGRCGRTRATAYPARSRRAISRSSAAALRWRRPCNDPSRPSCRAVSQARRAGVRAGRVAAVAARRCRSRRPRRASA
jgi:glycosyltransferase involved in cell wall biosynthesis